jgi:A/G-specific adenine glycosylase
MTGATFASRLLHWFDRHGRHDLPWQHPRTPYRVWISEIMLQQTQVSSVIPYFERFIARFPDLPALAGASIDDVLALWSGLGYYSRARNLHRAAIFCMERHDAALPRTFDDLLALPGIGRSTAAAILAQAHGDRIAILDGNVKRVLARHAGIEGVPATTAIERKLWQVAESHLPPSRMADYTQALMDFGATRCTARRPACAHCPVAGDCVAHATDRVAFLPTPRARKAVPERSLCMLVLINEDEEVLFERRPPIGIWGGLLSLPEFPSTDAARVAASRWGVAMAESRTGAVYRHRFTHFTLDITPCILQIRTHAQVSDDASAWHDRDRLADLALPTAVRRVLHAALAVS